MVQSPKVLGWSRLLAEPQWLHDAVGLVAVAMRGTPRWSTIVALISFTKLIHHQTPPNRDPGADGMVSVVGQN